MSVSAIIPVKTFSKAKTRLNLPDQKKDDLCKAMLHEVLKSVSGSEIIDKTLVVSKDEDALKISKQYNAIQIFDEAESGVNNAVSLADQYLEKNGFDASVVLPQDIPSIKPQDIEFLLKQMWMRRNNQPKRVLVVPSRRFDGTNALVRMPVNIMETHYDEDSYKIHLMVGKTNTGNTSLVLVRRIMLDIDNQKDLRIMLENDDKPDLCQQIRRLLF